MRKDNLLTSENIRKTGIPGCCRPAPGVQDPHKAHKRLLAWSHKIREVFTFGCELAVHIVIGVPPTG